MPKHACSCPTNALATSGATLHSTAPLGVANISRTILRLNEQLGVAMSVRYDEQKNIAYIKMTGVPTRESVLATLEATVSDERYQDGMGRLWDFTEADLSGFDSATIQEMAKYSLKFPPGIGDVKVAFVAHSKLEFGLARMFGAFSDVAKTTVSAFYSMEEAEAWLTS